MHESFMRSIYIITSTNRVTRQLDSQLRTIFQDFECFSHIDSANVEARHPERRQPLGIAYADWLASPSSVA